MCGLRNKSHGGLIQDLKESLEDQGHRTETESCSGHTYDGSLLVDRWKCISPTEKEPAEWGFKKA